MRFLLRHILVLFLLIPFLSGCGEELPEKVTPPTSVDGRISFELSLPTVEDTFTRGDSEASDNLITNMSVMIFKGENLAQTIVLGSSQSDFSNLNSGKPQPFEITLSEELRTEKSLQFYFIANYTIDETPAISEVSSVSDLLNVRISRIPDGSAMSPVPLCAKATLSELATLPVSLVRSVAKITVEYSSESDVSGNSSNTIYYPFTLCNSNVNGIFMGGVTNQFTSRSTRDSDDIPQEYRPVYSFPTPADNLPAIILKAPYDGVEENYYRIELKSGNRYIDLLPNHHYKVIIREIAAPGYSSFAEAVAGKSSVSISFSLVDKTPEILSIVSDYTHCIGSPKSLSFSASDTGTNNITLTYYSSSSEDLKTAPSITCNDQWIKIGVPSISLTQNKAVYPVEFNDDGISGIHCTVLLIQWHGLQKELPLTWDPAFDLNSICNVSLAINCPGQDPVEISDYGKFLSGEGSETGKIGTAPRLYGIDSESMGGRVRNQGLHFPVMYGTQGAEWSYSYEIRMSGLKNLDSGEWSVFTDPHGDRTINEFLTIESRSGSHVKGSDDIVFRVSRPGNCASGSGGTDYDYGTSRLLIELKSADTVTRRSLDLYHTGFFHYDSADSEYLTESLYPHSPGYYYYEVLPVIGKKGTIHILDRNLGASAAGEYMENYLCENIFSSKNYWPYSPGSASCGDHFTVKAAATDAGINVSSFTPPGYTLPDAREWKEILAYPSFGFDSFYVTNEIFHSVYLDAEVSELGKSISIRSYFPKTRFYEGVDITGMPDYGYYWTRTAPGGISESSQHGNWLQYLVLNTRNAEFRNGRLSASFLSARCIGIR